MTDTLCIYVLRLNHNKIYVGKSNNVNKRIKQHMEGQGSRWTKLHKVIDIIKIINNADKYDEDKYVKIYMEKYGIKNVRGGSYINIELEDYQLESLENELCMSIDLCTKCGKKGHFVKDCRAIISERCGRCGRDGHTEYNCYAKINIDDEEIDDDDDEEIDDVDDVVFACEYCDKEFDTEKGCRYHENIYCKFKNYNMNRRQTKTKKSYTFFCERCGRDGHIEDNCYAKINIDNEEIDDDDVFECEYCNKEFDTEKGCRYHENIYCKFRNKKINRRQTKSFNNCECKYCGKEFDTPNGCRYHENKYCKAKNKY